MASMPVGIEAPVAIGTTAATQATPATSYDTSDPWLPQVEEADYRKIVTGGATGRAGDLIAEAKKWVGTPYKWGQSGPLGFDCSGFTQYVFKQFGVNLPRISYQQGQGGSAVAEGGWQPGDLLFWDSGPRNPGADHVAIYLGDGMMISAPKPGDKVKIQAVYGKPWARRYVGGE
jgi:cell wall-associated NlpC family hydrolase